MTNWTVMLNEKIIRKFTLEDGEKKTIGRGKEADIIIDNQAISRLHISIESAASIYLISDMGSKNGSYVNGSKIESNEPVSETDLIEFGKFRLLHSTDSSDSSDVTDSVAADSLDLDEETVFVSSKPKEGQAKKSFTPRGSGPCLVLVSGSGSPKELSLEGKNSIKIGKDNSCDMVVSGFFVANAQCYIFKRDGKYMLVPQKSWVGTFVNDEKVTEERPLRNSDIIKIKSTTIRFEE